MDKIVSKPIPHFKKGDAFVGMASHPLVFMEINEVKGDAGNKDFCIVTWYSLDERESMLSVDSLWLLLKVSSVTSSQSLETFSKRLKA